MDQAPAAFSTHVIRFELNAQLLRSRGQSASHVAGALIQYLACTAQVVYGQDFIRVRPLVACPATAKPALFYSTLCKELAARLCRDICLGGVRGVSASRSTTKTFYYVDEDGQIQQRDMRVVEVSGSNLREAAGAANVCGSLTSSNDAQDVLCALGIEAAASVLFHQLMQCLSADGSVISERHGAVLASLMTHLGHLLPISRHGINRVQTRSGGQNVGNGIMSRTSFEECVDQLLESALSGEFDPCKCPSSRIMIGRRIQTGTGLCFAETDLSYKVQGEAEVAEEVIEDEESSSVDEPSEEEMLGSSSYKPSSPRDYKRGA